MIKTHFQDCYMYDACCIYSSICYAMQLCYKLHLKVAATLAEQDTTRNRENTIEILRTGGKQFN